MTEHIDRSLLVLDLTTAEVMQLCVMLRSVAATTRYPSERALAAKTEAQLLEAMAEDAEGEA